MAFSSAVPSTPMELVSRLTEQAVTPGTAFTAFSTRAEQAAQLMPVTLYWCIPISFLFAFPRRGTKNGMSRAPSPTRNGEARADTLTPTVSLRGDVAIRIPRLLNTDTNT